MNEHTVPNQFSRLKLSLPSVLDIVMAAASFWIMLHDCTKEVNSISDMSDRCQCRRKVNSSLDAKVQDWS